MDALRSGTRLGPYEIVERVGEGGMGAVYRARDTRLGRDVAIKVLPQKFAGDPDRLRRFELEAKAVGALNHPNICQIYDVGPGYLVLEYVEGEPISGPLPVREAVRLSIEIADALREAHSRGILHRDLKPGNILLTRKRSTKLLDFGLAKLVDRLDDEADALTRTVDGAVLGTASYMSPEQAAGRPLDARSDVFSFGVVVYELLSGRRAFDGQTHALALTAVLRDEPKPLDVSPRLDRIVRRCLAKNPDERFPTIADVLTALQQLDRAPGREAPSIAVLPFVDMSPGKDHEYFSDGQAEEIINALTHVTGLKVIARTSAFAFKGQNVDVRRIAEMLGVTHVLEGSVRKAGDRVRVTAQLIAATDGSHVWSERYDRELADVFAIQDDIAQAIATALRTRLAPTASSTRRHTPSLPAYEAFLKARHHLQRWTPESLAKGREQLELAVRLDPEFAPAHTELGWCFFALVTENQMLPGEAATLMRSHAQRALAIDPSLPDPHAVLGLVAVLDYNWAEAGRHFHLACAQEPIAPLVRYFHSGFFLAPLGRMREAEHEMERLIEDDPLNLFWRSGLGMYLVGTGRLSEGEAALRQVLDLDASFWLAQVWLVNIFLIRGAYADALPLAKKAYALSPTNWASIGLLAGVVERTGNTGHAASLIEKLGDGSAFGAPVGFTCYHLALGEIDRAADWLERLIVQRDTRAPWIVPHSQGAPLLRSARWPQLAKMMNLPHSAISATS